MFCKSNEVLSNMWPHINTEISRPVTRVFGFAPLILYVCNLEDQTLQYLICRHKNEDKCLSKHLAFTFAEKLVERMTCMRLSTYKFAPVQLNQCKRVYVVVYFSLVKLCPSIYFKLSQNKTQIKIRVSTQPFELV